MVSSSFESECRYMNTANDLTRFSKTLKALDARADISITEITHLPYPRTLQAVQNIYSGKATEPGSAGHRYNRTAI